MDPITGVVATTALAKFGPAAGKLLERIAGPGADELGEWFRDKVKSFRYRNTKAVADRAEEMVSAGNGEPQEVRLSILLPLLEAASLQDDLEMQEYWAALLANAAMGITASPAYSRILEMLGPQEAKILRACGDIDRDARGGSSNIPMRGGYAAMRSEIARRIGIDSAVQFEIALDTLVSLRLLDPVPAVYPLDPDLAENGKLGVRVTSLGRAFLEAVTPPAERRL